jgi:hypothetical protein
VTEYVVDTNVWVTVDLDVSTATLEELDCAAACRKWLREFINGADKLVVDLDYKIIKEYRDNLAKGGLSHQWLNRLETQPRDLRLVELKIAYDADGYALVPPEVAIHDLKDRKFVAVALARKPTPPIVNGTDTDWSKDQAMLDTAGIQVQELCPAYIQVKLNTK